MAGQLSFEAVYAEHAGYVRRALQRLGIQPPDLDDVVQDTFVTVHRQLPGFEGRSALETWLHAICWRTAASYHRRAHTRREIASETIAPVAASAGTDEIPPRDELLASLAPFTPDDGDLFALHAIGELSILELSELTGLARATIRRRLETTRSRLERRLASGSGAHQAIEPQAGKPAPDSESRGHADMETATSDYCISRIHDLIFARWRGDSRVPGLEALSEIMLRAADETPGGIAYLSVVEPTAGPPDGPARAAHRSLAAKLGSRLRIAAFTTRSQGLFRLLPPIINTCVFLSGARSKMRFFAEEQAAFEYLGDHARTTPAMLRVQNEHMRRRIDAAELRAAACTLGRSPEP